MEKSTVSQDTVPESWFHVHRNCSVLTAYCVRYQDAGGKGLQAVPAGMCSRTHNVLVTPARVSSSQKRNDVSMV